MSRSRSRRGSERSTSSSVDDTVGHIDCRDGDILNERFSVQRLMGMGTFGKVFQCIDAKHRDIVAVKVVRRIKRYIESAHIEADVLKEVYRHLKKERSSCCVLMYSNFNFRGYYCMVFEPLGISLYDLIKRNDYCGLPISNVRSFAKQLLEAMKFLKSMRLIHTDLKLENILLYCNQFEEKDYKVYIDNVLVTKRIDVPVNNKIKLIDFGGATFDDDRSKSRIINTRQYRSPEVIMELKWSFPSDIWSVGCILAEIMTGTLLYATHEDLEHLFIIEYYSNTHIPHWMVESSDVSKRFFFKDGSRYYLDKGRLSSSSRHFLNDLKPLRETLRNVYVNDSDIEAKNLLNKFVGLVSGLLIIDPYLRLAAEEALTKDFCRV